MWRQFTQWLGGMGIIVLALAVLPRLRVGGRQLLESEVPGPGDRAADRHDPGHGAAAVAPLRRADRRSIARSSPCFGWTRRRRARWASSRRSAHAFATLPTGGFSHAGAGRSSEFAAATQWVVALFMVLAGANFALLYRAFVRAASRASFARDEEFRLYVGAARARRRLLIVVELSAEGLHAARRRSGTRVFQAVSIMTTTGFASVDFNVWPALAARDARRR